MVRVTTWGTPSIIAALVLFAGCGQQLGSSITAAPSALLPAVTPQAMRGGDEVQYISNYYDTYLTEFDYPRSDSQIGRIANVGGGICTKGARTFWVVASADTVEEFRANGKRPIARRTITAGNPAGCAVDGTTDDLAVPILTNGDVMIFKPGSKSGTSLSSGLTEALFGGYDGNGNLFVDGFNSSSAFQLVELPKGSSNFENISIGSAITFPNSIQWDGRYLTLGCSQGICRYRILGTKAILKGVVAISSDCAGYWIARPYVYCADAGNNDGEVFKYPAGGLPIATLSGSFDFPVGVVSLRVH
jgi:hypothetical protein